MSTFAPPFGTNIPPIGGVMTYIFFSSVFITLFLVLGAVSLYGFIELMQAKYPLSWTCYQHVFVLAIIAVLCFIAACYFGTQIPDCYAPTKL